MEAYFDNSATTIVTDSVKDIVVKTMTEDFGNPSAMHMVGVKAEKYIKEAQENIAKILLLITRQFSFVIVFIYAKLLKLYEGDILSCSIILTISELSIKYLFFKFTI